MARVLVVEDDPDQRALRRLVLESAGHEVTLAASAAGADRVLAHFAPEAILPDVILMDLRLPAVEDGLALIRHVGARLPVIVLSGSSRPSLESLPVFRAFQKPCGSEALLDAIRAAVPHPGTSTLETAFLVDSIVLEHRTGPGHPERPERFEAVRQGLSGFPLIETARTANADELAAVHTRDYLRLAQEEIRGGASELSTGDTAVCPRSFDVALRASGLVLNAVDLVAGAQARNAFCAVRPPGHHANASRGMGFCILNNVAVAARYAQRKHSAGRVLVADWDVHHGNGTQDIFYADGSVLFFSAHQHPWYPGTGMASETGDGPGEGTTINRPLPAGAGSREILGAFRGALTEAAERFRPDIVFISAGFDSRLGDPLGGFLLEDRDFASLTSCLMEIADKHCAGRLISVLEGGYSLPGLTSAVRAHASALQGLAPSLARR